MISVKRFVRLEKMAQQALKSGDHATIHLINQDAELRSANCQFIVRDDVLFLGTVTDEQKPDPNRA